MLESYVEFKFNSILRLLNKLKDDISKPFIFNAGTLNNQFFETCFDDNWDIYSYIEGKLFEYAGEDNIWNVADKICIKDQEWGEWRNRNLAYEVYHKYTLKPEYVEMLLREIEQLITEVEGKLEEFLAQREQKKIEEENYKKSFEVIKVYKKVMPRGGEDGRDGYYDADILNTDSKKITRMVARNVFDFGFYTYPKRLEGTKDMFNRNNWTEEEINVSKWLNRFPPFTTSMRM